MFTAVLPLRIYWIFNTDSLALALVNLTKTRLVALHQSQYSWTFNQA